MRDDARRRFVTMMRTLSPIYVSDITLNYFEAPTIAAACASHWLLPPTSF